MKIQNAGKVATQTNLEQKKDKGVLTSKSHHISTLDQLIAHCNIDLEEWEVDHYVANSWQVGARVDGVIIVQPLFQIKAWLNKKKRVKESKHILSDFIEDAKKHAPKYKKIEYPKSKEKYCLEISTAELHFGKLAWAEETGDDYDMKIAKDLFNKSIDALCQRAQAFPLEKILFVVGNDLLNVDNNTSMTTSGTPQDEDSRWQKSFIEIRKILVETIDRLQLIAPVEVIMVSGNHDMQRIFYVGDVLAAWYHNCPNVKIDNSPTLRKYFRYGKVLIGFTHGDKENLKNLPLIMATERPQDWGETKYREIHIGHFHKKKEMEFTSVDEFNGVRVRILPSLSATDAWHASKGYRTHRSSEAYIWNKETGYVGHFSYSPI